MSQKFTLSFSNPRLRETISDWPLSVGNGETVIFNIESHDRWGDMATRTSLDSVTGRIRSSKVLPYMRTARIVDGSDCLIYVVCLTHLRGIEIYDRSFDWAGTLFEDAPRYPEFLTLTLDQ